MPDSRRDRDPRPGQLADEQAALRRVAALVARGVIPEEIFAAVSEEVAQLFRAECSIARFEPRAAAMIVVGMTEGIPVSRLGMRMELEDFMASTAVYRTGRPARIDHRTLRSGSGPLASAVRELPFISAVAAPIVVEGDLWGAMQLVDTRKPLPPDAAERVEKFTELVGTAIANAQSRAELAKLAEEQAALRRVATLVARGASPEELFSAVSNEVGRIFGSQQITVGRFEHDGSAAVIVGVSEGIRVVSIGSRWELEDFTATTAVYRTGRPARKEKSDFEKASGLMADRIREVGIVSSVTAPIVVEGDLWGVITVADLHKRLPSDTEERLEKFTELVATAIANAESRAELAASEARARDLAREQAALRRVATLVAEGASAEELFAAVAHEVAGVIGLPVVGMHRYEGDGAFTTMGITGDTTFNLGSRWPVEDEGIAGTILATGHPARKEDYTKMPGPVGEAMRDDQMVSAVGVPIVVNGDIWGFVVAGGKSGDLIPANTEERLARFTELVATAIANSQAREHLAQLADEQAALRRVATLVARGVSPEETFSAVSGELARLFQADAAIARFEPDGSAMVIVGVTEGTPLVSIGSRVEFEDFMASTAVYRTGRSARIDHDVLRSASSQFAARVRELNLISTVAAPIVVEGDLWGAMQLVDTRKPLPPDAAERVEKFTELVGTAIANAQSRAELAASEARAHKLADEQAALRRVATLVAKAAKPDEVFSAVAREVADVFGVEMVTVCRYDSDHIVVLSSVGVPAFPAGSRWSLDVPSLPSSVYKTGGPVRIDDFTNASGLDALARDAGVKAAVGVPILVEGNVWGSINTAGTEDEAFSADPEERLARFTDLIATAVSNANMRAEIAASRARIVAAADQERRRVVRDLHDGAQQRLVHTIITLKLAEQALEEGTESASALFAEARQHAEQANAELRDLAHGILPSVLTHGGVAAGVEALVARLRVPVSVNVSRDRLPPEIEANAYFVIAEALTNVAKHSGAQRADVTAWVDASVLHVDVHDDGAGGARPDGSGLLGLADRVAALGGQLRIESPPGGGTRIAATLPLQR